MQKLEHAYFKFLKTNSKLRWLYLQELSLDVVFLEHNSTKQKSFSLKLSNLEKYVKFLKNYFGCTTELTIGFIIKKILSKYSLNNNSDRIYNVQQEVFKYRESSLFATIMVFETVNGACFRSIIRTFILQFTL